MVDIMLAEIEKKNKKEHLCCNMKQDSKVKVVIEEGVFKLKGTSII